MKKQKLPSSNVTNAQVDQAILDFNKAGQQARALGMASWGWVVSPADKPAAR